MTEREHRERIFHSLVSTIIYEVTLHDGDKYVKHNKWGQENIHKFNISSKLVMKMIDLEIMEITGGNDYFNETHYILNVDVLRNILRTIPYKDINNIFTYDDMCPIYAQLRNIILDKLIL